MEEYKNKMQKKYDRYKHELIEAIENIDENLIDRMATKIVKVTKKRGSVFLAGNGGSASIASHLACDLQKTAIKDQDLSSAGKRIKAICLNDSAPIMTAWSNDYDFSKVFSEPLTSLAEKGDLLILISSSGNSANILSAALRAKEMNVEIMALVGFDGGKLKTLADESIHIENSNYGVVESVHQIIAHALAMKLKDTSF